MTELSPADATGRRGLTATQWLICAIAAIGFAFDIYEILMAPLVVPPALQELGGLRPGTPDFVRWASAMFYAPALCGGFFGLIGGYLTDRLGRRRVLTWSILLYAFSAFAAGFSTSLPMLLVLRCTTFIGVCVEFVAAIAWLAELFVEPARREKVLGYTQAFSSVGGFMIAVAYGFAVEHGQSLPAINLPDWLHFGTEAGKHDAHAAWRYTLMSGLVPAIPLILIRPFLPESPVWQQKKAAGTLRRPSFAALFAPALRRTTVVTTLMFACSYGAAFGAIQQISQIVGGLPEVQAEAKEAGAKAAAAAKAGKAGGGATAGAKAIAETKPTAAADAATRAVAAADPLPTTAPALVAAAVESATRATATSPTTLPAGLTAPGALGAMASTKPAVAAATDAKKGGPSAGGPPDPAKVASTKVIQANAANVTKVQEVGGLVGRFVLAVLAAYIVSRRSLIRVFQLPGLIIMPIAFAVCAIKGINYLYAGIFLAGFVTVAQLSFWGNYLPRVYPVHLRGTGESFAANVGGRMVGTLFFGLTQVIAGRFTAEGATPAQVSHTLAYTAAAVGFGVYLIGFALSFALPEPGLTDPEE